MKRLIALMSAAIIAAGMFTSCRKTYPYDTDKAISLATEYMKNKYGKDIKDVETYKKTHGSDAYIGVKFKLDETDAEKPDTNTYEVRVYVDGEGEENHYVRCGNYMNTLFVPFIEEGIGQVLKQNGINDYMLTIDDIYQFKARENNYYTTDYRIPDQDTDLEFYFKNYKLNFYCYVSIPDSVKAQISTSQKCIDYIGDKIKVIFDDDHMHLRVDIFNDSEFELVKVGNSNNYKSYDYYREFIQRSKNNGTRIKL